jgi:hypothetical protein
MMVFRVIQVFVLILTVFFIVMAIVKGVEEVPANESATSGSGIKLYIIMAIAGILLSFLLHIFIKKIVKHLD